MGLELDRFKLELLCFRYRLNKFPILYTNGKFVPLEAARGLRPGARTTIQFHRNIYEEVTLMTHPGYLVDI